MATTREENQYYRERRAIQRLTPPKIVLPFHFDPRPYQFGILSAMDSGCKRAVHTWHRRAGKEKTDLNLVAKKMMERVGAYYYIFPTFVQGRKILWDGADKEGFRHLDHFPKALLDGKPNNTEMKLRFKNGSLFQVVGSDNFNSVVGTNPIGVVLSEYSLQDPLCWAFFRPILAENGGWAVFNFTPRGENHAYDLLELARANPFDAIANPSGWFSEVLTAHDTGAINPEVLAQELDETVRLYGNRHLYDQEYFCSFTAPIQGAYYADQLMKTTKETRIGNVAHDPAIVVDTYWDLGVNDRMAIWFVQQIGTEVHLIDYMEDTGYGLDHYIPLLKADHRAEYVYGKHVAPHDIKARELTNGKSRLETAKKLGIDFRVAPSLGVMDGIDAARLMFGKCWFDKKRCAAGINALKNYRKQWDEKRKTYGNHPYHDWSSNGSDAFRMLAVSLDLKRRGISVEETRKDGYQRAQERQQRKSEGGLW